MAGKNQRYLTATVIMDGYDTPIVLVDSEGAMYASSALEAFEHHRLIKTKAEIGGTLMNVVANPDKVVAISYTESTQAVEYTDDVCDVRVK